MFEGHTYRNKFVAVFLIWVIASPVLAIKPTGNSAAKSLTEEQKIIHGKAALANPSRDR